MTPAEQFGLWLNLDAIRYQQALPIKMAIEAATGHGALGRGWFEAIAFDEAEVDELEYRTNADREWHAIKSRHGFGS